MQSAVNSRATYGKVTEIVTGTMPGGAKAIAGSFLIGQAAFAQSGRSKLSNIVDHIVILVRENRSFDHDFGSMCGVRGFGTYELRRSQTASRSSTSSFLRRKMDSFCRSISRRRRRARRNRTNSVTRGKRTLRLIESQTAGPLQLAQKRVATLPPPAVPSVQGMPKPETAAFIRRSRDSRTA